MEVSTDSLPSNDVASAAEGASTSAAPAPQPTKHRKEKKSKKPQKESKTVANLLASLEGYITADVDPEVVFVDYKEIGHGSTGSVFQARDSRTDEVVAIKKMLIIGAKAEEDWDDVVREIKFMANCQHENIIKYFGTYLKNEYIYIVMEFCAGSGVDILEVFKVPLSESEIGSICAQTLRALDYMHGTSKIHRDIKGGNILLREDGVVKLIDFGASTQLKPGVSKANTFVGTPYWMAPELITAMESGFYDAAVDIWSLGITCIEFAQLKPPHFQMHAMSALFHIPQADPPTLEAPHWSGDFREFLAKCLQPDAAQRWSAHQLLQHSFIKNNEKAATTVIAELVGRSKDKVREIDLADLMENLADIDRKIETERTANGQESARLLTEKETQKKALQEAKKQGATMQKARETLRPRHLLVRDTLEAPQQERQLVRSQMKELRLNKEKQHKAEKVLIKQQSNDLDTLRKGQARDYETTVKSQEAELERMRKEQRDLVESLQKSFQNEKKKLSERLKDDEKKLLKEHKDKLKAEMKVLESRQKDEAAGVDKNDKKELQKRQKDDLARMQTEKEMQFQRQLGEMYEARMNQLSLEQKQKLDTIVQEHAQLEKDMLHAHSSVRIQIKLDQQSMEHDLLMTQLTAQHNLTENNQALQHRIEWSQLLAIHEKQEEELLKEQLSKQKYHKQILKKSEDDIRKRYQRTLSGAYDHQRPPSMADPMGSGGSSSLNERPAGHSRSGSVDMDKTLKLSTKKDKEQFDTFRSSFIDEETQKLDRFQKMQAQKLREAISKEQTDVARYHNERKQMLKAAHQAERQRVKEKQDAFFVLLKQKLEHEWNSSVA
ncbi:TAO kinase 1 [Capsaspora owczarzaki ATCC 30864]|uniref:non-specific serine/threonine protein kinase n=1 Tax=Capsaspora owczarzaki (strain ATCC 30864) TaxID=595528 RepID=A0A0D2X0X2_CAPO3|nr:TAO kinase 1 [Capsaspora owczarzaki ATCC 30864]KJE89802.1 STE/STE20/TAO protein kinase [Capsaspora owczarzaki ATCC 30864]KJE89803.1 STE/STE20/TAO protein kinase, variant 1 [Capsaspora owczarzaki ATCC 30864]KJE89804.1 STE/STE20/TAO protein kinase, variant 2 [Capsaspora owczarzaki ATCC 30864]|eukprot:XP_004349746.1 TAO kinase 1 [Capsaspora owczarzaki ATCC 30864]